ncbi:hypothetical protein [Nostoc sp.]|uniref:hypothetical protein n=1 Tax=Nostoc sp. TaxID=1180 RepID=UPI002FEF85F1
MVTQSLQRHLQFFCNILALIRQSGVLRRRLTHRFYVAIANYLIAIMLLEDV